LCNQTRPGGVRGLLTQRVSFVLLRVAFKIRIDPNFVVRVVSCRATRFHCPRKGPYEPGSGKVSGWNQGCQMGHFQTKTPKFCSDLQWKMLVYFMAIWSISCHLVPIFLVHWKQMKVYLFTQSDMYTIRHVRDVLYDTRQKLGLIQSFVVPCDKIFTNICQIV
jgi:hypothetical protein